MSSQHQVLEIDEIGNPFLVLGVVDLSPDQKDMDEIKFRLVNNKTGEMTPFPLTEETNIKFDKYSYSKQSQTKYSSKNEYRQCC